MSETPTPETDAEAMEKLAIVRKQLVAMKELNEARMQRDEARKKLDYSDTVMKWSASKVEELNKGLIRLVKERDEARRELEELKRAAIEVLNVIPSPECSFFGHSKRDMHSALEPCPVVDRYNAKIDNLLALLKEEV